MSNDPLSDSLDTGARWSVAVTGSTGFIGSALVDSLERDGHRVVRVVRSRSDARPGSVLWDPTGGSIDREGLEGLDAVVHLAGENVGERWTDEKKRRIRESREQGTRLIAETLASLRNPPRVLVTASGVGYYGMDRGDEELTEASAPGTDWFAEVAQAWEASAAPAAAAGIRVASLRMGIVLGEEGALAKMLLPFRMGVGGKMGSGRQWMSWIALADAVDAYRFVIGTTGMEGAVNAVAPEAVTNEEFTRTLGRVLGRPTLFTVPETALQVMFGEMADATILASQRVVPDRLLGAGFVFRYPRLEAALRQAVG